MNGLDAMTLLGAIGSALVGGTFFAFSSFVMAALGKLPPPQGVSAMQSINIVVINPWFMSAFLGTTVLCSALAVASLAGWSDPGAGYRLTGSVLYVAGTFLVTMIFNVPRNNALAKVTPSSTEAAILWTAYLSSWTAWNHVRTIAAIGALVSFTMALRFRS